LWKVSSQSLDVLDPLVRLIPILILRIACFSPPAEGAVIAFGALGSNGLPAEMLGPASS